MSSESATQPWTIEKKPLNKVPAPFAGSLLLPTTYRGVGGNKKISVWKGDDLNHILFEHYAEVVVGDQPGINYIDVNALSAKRHEYLGPSPFVSGFRFQARQKVIDVEWYDEFLRTKWISGET